jgi:hypothetical protein
LHVTNGDAVVPALRALPVDGEVLPWRDVLHDGPVPGWCDAAALREMRARFIAGAGWAPYADVLADFTRRDEVLAAAQDEIVLWFEHDLYDQLQLLQVLDALAAAGRSVTLAQSARHLTSLSSDALRELGDGRHEVTRDERDLARRAWAAFRGDDPRAVAALASGESAALPHLGPAFRRLLEELPSVRNGLSRTEAQALAAIREGARTVADAFAVSQRHEEAVFLGDASFVLRVDALARCAHPLVRRTGERVELTDAGGHVLDGAADHVAMNGVDRWLGGLHVHGHDPWRWDVDAGRPVGPS